MKYLILFICSLLSGVLPAQEENPFLDRDFWKSHPDVATVKAKIEEGHDPAAMTSAAFDGVIYAMLEKAPVATIQYLLDLPGNEVDKNTHDGRNYLMWAAYSGNVELVRDLIKRGSDIKLVDDHGYGVITFSATTGMSNPEVYDVLLANGADIHEVNRDGANALLLISSHLGEDLTMVDYFIEKGIERSATDQYGNGLFNYAARKGNIALMKKAVEWGLPYLEKNQKGGNAVLFASRGYRSYTNGKAVYQYLEDLGLPINVKTKAGETPLHNIALRVQDMDLFQFFIDRGVDINQADGAGNTLLLNAVRGGNTDIARAFIPKVADINHQNADGFSALTYAVRRADARLMEDLLKAGADIQVKDEQGNNLVAHLFDTFRAGQERSFDQILSLMTDRAVDLKATQAGGNTLLHLAVEQQQKFLVGQAIEAGVDLNAKNDNGLTAMHLAAMKAKNPDILLFLIEKGADKDIKTDFEESVLDLAKENEMLNKAGFNLDILKK